MIPTLWRKAVQISRQLYVRVMMIAFLSVVSLLVAKLLGPVIPEGFSETIGAKAVDPILETLASSMLAVTIFSLTIMAGAFRSSASQWSPRSHVILKDDTTTHSVLATFVGAYLFALMAIVLRSAHFFGESEIVALFGFTIGVILLIVINLIRWIAHLEDLGSLEETGNQIQARAESAMRAIGHSPCYGAHCLDDLGAAAQEDGQPVTAPRAGYVQQVFQEELQNCAETADARIYVTAGIGTYVQKGEVLARVVGTDQTLDKTVQRAILIDSTRSFQQDPGFGLLVLAEIASRALSPGINDSETAIDMVNRVATVLALADPPQASDAEREEGPKLDRVWMRPPDFDLFFLTCFDQIARDAGGKVEVHLAIARQLRGLADRDRPELVAAARASATRCSMRARDALEAGLDLKRYLAETGRS